MASSFFSPRFGLSLVIAALGVGLGTFCVLTGLTPIHPSPSVVLGLLAINAVSAGSLLWSVGERIISLIRDRRKHIAGSDLHIRLVLLLSLCAALPALVVAIFASVTLDRGLDAWFSKRTRTIVDSAENVARIYIKEHGDSVRGDVIFMARDLEQQKELYDKDRSGFSKRIASYATLYGLSGVFIVNEPERRLEASTVANSSISFHPPTPDMFARARSGQLVLVGPGDGNVIQVLVKLNGFSGIYLYVYRLVNPEVINQLLKVRAEKREYNAVLTQRQNLQITFGLMYAGLSLVFLLSAIWLGLRFSDRLATPIVQLVQAAQKVSEGDFDAKVDSGKSAGDLLTLTNTFNRMTKQLKSQREDVLRTNRLLDQRRRFTEAVLEGVRAGVIGLDGTGRITLVNRSACTLLKRTNDQLSGQFLSQALPEMAQALKETESSGITGLEIKIEGQERTFVVQRTQEHSDYEAEKIGSVVTFDDITDLVTAQRTSAWADVARRIAHEIKNPLTPIQLAAERLRRKYQKEIHTDPHVFEHCTATIIRQVEDIGRMVDEFSSFARMPQAHLTWLPLGETIRHCVLLYEQALSDIALKVELADPDPFVFLDSRLMGQAITNLLKNATEAIEARRAQDPSVKGEIILTMTEEEDSIFVDITDNGIGLPLKNRPRLKEPYVTTREKGTGLGLAIVNKIMEDHGGQLFLLDRTQTSSTPGALIRLVFPKTQPQREAV